MTDNTEIEVNEFIKYGDEFNAVIERSKLKAFISQKLEEAEERVRGEIIQNSEGFIQTTLMPESAYKLAHEQGRIQGRGEAVEIAEGMKFIESKLSKRANLGEVYSYNQALSDIIQHLTNKE